MLRNEIYARNLDKSVFYLMFRGHQEQAVVSPIAEVKILYAGKAVYSMSTDEYYYSIFTQFYTFMENTLLHV